MAASVDSAPRVTELNLSETQDINENCEKKKPTAFGIRDLCRSSSEDEDYKKVVESDNDDTIDDEINYDLERERKEMKDMYRRSPIAVHPESNTESTKLLRGILQTGERKPHELFSPNSDNSLITTLLQNKRDSVFPDVEYDRDSPIAASPSEMSECSDKKDDISDDLASTEASGDTMKQAKRARVENIITNMRFSPNKTSGDSLAMNGESRRQKRKQYTPQQHDIRFTSEEPSPKVPRIEGDGLREQLKTMQEQLSVMQQRYDQLFDETRLNGDRKYDALTRGLDTELPEAATPESFNKLRLALKQEIMKKVGSLVDTVVSNFVESRKLPLDDVKKRRSPTPPRDIKKCESKSPSPIPQKSTPTLNIPQPKPPRTKVTDKLSHPFFESHHRMLSEFTRLPHSQLFPPPFFPHTQVPQLQPLYAPPPKEPEQTEALALVVNTPKKKRTKVTDTRLSPRAAKALLQENSLHASENEKHHVSPNQQQEQPAYPPGAALVPVSLPTSVAIPNPSLQHSDIMAMYSEHSAFTHPARPTSRSPPIDHPFTTSFGGHLTPENHHHHLPLIVKPESETPERSNTSFERSFDRSFNDSPCDGFNGQTTSTLTPMHLRKAKLMFFYVRYPSSAIIKMYFPDVKFNKNNTAQLVKWFSNFREFYYIQMEKYARQALAEGITTPEEVFVTGESELYRVLNLHYNRNNQIEVPDHFRVVVQATLREFFKSIQAGKDSEQSWKKAIYKIIARLDSNLPDFFKSPNWMEQLSDG